MLLLALTLLPGLLVGKAGGSRQVTVIDQSGDAGLFDAIKAKMQSPPKAENPMSGDQAAAAVTGFALTRKVAPADRSSREIAQEHAEEVRRESNRALVILPPGILDGASAEYYAKSVGDFTIRRLEQAISQSVIERRFAREGVDKSKVEGYTRKVDLVTFKVTNESISEENSGASFAISFTMLMFIYMSVLFYGIFVMRGVIEEKQTRISEVLVSSVRPAQMMFGKLIGIGLVGLTQMSIWALSAAGLTTIGFSLFASRGINLPHISPMLFVYFLIYFLLGYFLYATLYAMVGATVSSDDDAQQAQFPITMLLAVSMIAFPLIMNNPNSPTATTLSMVPFFAPTLMIMRIGMVNPPLWQIALSMSIMAATILICVWIAGRIYRVGILMYGKRPSIAELGRWLRYT
jgi:ABC-2 type transport system permease protein